MGKDYYAVRPASPPCVARLHSPPLCCCSVDHTNQPICTCELHRLKPGCNCGPAAATARRLATRNPALIRLPPLSPAADTGGGAGRQRRPAEESVP